jgi:mutual gliding-motility protein MglA
MPGVMPIDELHSQLNPKDVPAFEAIAPQGVGVFDTLKAVAKLVLQELRKAGG